MKSFFACTFAICLCGLLLCGCAYVNHQQQYNKDNVKQVAENEFYLPNGLAEIEKYHESEFSDDSDSLEFIPSDEYGELLIFTGGAQIYTSETDEENQDELYDYGPTRQMRYGLCTKDGRIVKQAIYSYIMNTKCGHYVLHYPMEFNEGDDELAYHSKTDAQTVIPCDGSWKVEIPEGNWQNGTFLAEFGDDGSFATYTRIGGSRNNTFTFYNAQGKATATVTGYDYISKFSCGLARGRRQGNGFSEYDYLDINGNVVLGPYTSASDFTEKGVAQVGKTNLGDCLIDTSGNILTPFYVSMRADTYDPTNEYPFYALSNDLTQQTYFGRDGKQAFTLDSGDRTTLFGSGECISYRKYDGSYSFYRLSDNSEIVCSHCGNSPWDTVGGKYFIDHDSVKNTACVFGYDGKHIVTLENYRWSEELIEGTDILIYASSNPADPDKIYRVLYDLAKQQELISFEDANYVQTTNTRYLKIRINTIPTPTAYIYDIETGKKLFENSLSIDVQQGSDGKKYFSVYTNSHTRVYNENMEQIISFTNSNNV